MAQSLSGRSKIIANVPTFEIIFLSQDKPPALLISFFLTRFRGSLLVLCLFVDVVVSRERERDGKRTK